MLVHTTCPKCAKGSTVPDHYVGKRIKCTGCRGKFFVKLVSVEPLPIDPPAEMREPPDDPRGETVFSAFDERINWQGYPFFHCHCLRGRDDALDYRSYFTADRLVFVPYKRRPTALPGDPTRNALTAMAAGLTIGTGVGMAAAALAYTISKTNQEATDLEFRNQDERFREWKIEDLAQADPKAFVILAQRTVDVQFRQSKSGWVVLVVRRDNGHEWVIRPVADPDLKVCVDNLSRSGFRVTNSVEWDAKKERYRVVEEDIDLN
jgi:hypothetical protein